MFQDGEFQKLVAVGGDDQHRFGFNSGFEPGQPDGYGFDPNNYCGYLDRETFVDGAGNITYH